MRIAAIYTNTVPQKSQNLLLVAGLGSPEEPAPARGATRFVELAHKIGRSEGDFRDTFDLKKKPPHRKGESAGGSP